MLRTLPVVLLTGCLMPDLSDTLDPGPATLPPPEEGTLVDATSEVDWVPYDLDADELVTTDSLDWDVAFKRFQVDLPEGFGAAAVEAVPFDEVDEVPADGWRFDEPDADGDGIPEYALGDWYDYDYDTHTLSPADRVYVIETTDQQYVKLAFLSYYDQVGTPARITFVSETLPAP